MRNIILNEIRSYLRSGSNLFFTIFFPCACVFFLGTFLESVEVSDEVVGELSVVYCTDGGDAASAAAFEEFINALGSSGTLTAKKISGESIDGFDRDAVSAAVELSGPDIRIYGGNDKIKNRTLKAIFDSYSQTAAAYASAASVNPAGLTEVRDLDGSYAARKDLGTNRSMMDYYAVTMAVMILFMGCCIGGAGCYTEEHELSTIARLDASPVSRTAVFLGKIAGSLPMVLIQTASVMLASTLLFGAHYCRTLSGNFLLAALFISASLAALSVGVLLSLVFPRIPSNLVIMPVLWVAMFLSGTFAMDIYVRGLTECMPMYIIQRAAFDLTVFGRPEKAVRAIAVSLLVFAVMFFFGLIKTNARRKNF